MNFDQQRKIERLIINSAKAYEEMKDGFLKVPISMAVFSLSEQQTPKVRTYLAAQFIYSGKVRLCDNPTQKIAALINISPRTVYRHFNWLLHRNWMGKDCNNGWLFFRGIDQVHKNENWKYRRAAILPKKDLQQFKEFCIGAVISSIIKTGRGAGTERKRRRSEQSRFPISLYVIKKALGVSHKTAFVYRQNTHKKGFINMIPNLQQVEGLTWNDVRLLKENEIEIVTVNLFGNKESIKAKPSQLRQNKGIIYVQLPNLVNSNIQLKTRK